MKNSIKYSLTLLSCLLTVLAYLLVSAYSMSHTTYSTDSPLSITVNYVSEEEFENLINFLTNPQPITTRQSPTSAPK